MIGSRYTCLLAGAFAMALLAGCATPRQTLSLRESPPNVARQVELATVPFFPQERYQCGPAALATVLANQGLDVTPQQLEPEVYLPERHGSLQVELVAAARRRGRVVYPLGPPQLSNLIREVAAGHPILVMQNLGLSWLPQWHYAVVVGYDLTDETVILRSATLRRWKSSLAVFERTWARAGYWGLVILPPDLIPKTATSLGYLRAAHDLEAVGELTEAATAYRTAFHQWPGDYAVALALGNLEYRQGHYAAAEEVFRAALHVHPAQADLWNNLAYSLAAEQCSEEAIAAVQCAHRLAPQDNNILDSERELTAHRGEAPPPVSACLSVPCPTP